MCCSAVVLFRPAADTTELCLLMAGSLGHGLEYVENTHVKAYTQAYYSLMCSKEPLIGGGIVFRERYGLRDFYNFGRYFVRRKITFPPSDIALLNALERNFNGASKQEFQILASKFFDEVSDAIGRSRAMIPACRSVVRVLHESIFERDVDAKRMNETIVRYQLVLDETEDDSAARLLFQCGILDRSQTIVYDLSDFPDDRNDVVRSTMISNIKHAMMTGKTVFLMHTAPIHGSLYDLLNQHFTRMEIKGEVVYHANVAIGSYSRPCQVCPAVLENPYKQNCMIACIAIPGAPEVPLDRTLADHCEGARPLLQPF